MAKTAPSTTAVRTALHNAGARAAARCDGKATVVMAEGDRVGPAFAALREAGYTLEVIGEGGYVQAAIVTLTA